MSQSSHASKIGDAVPNPQAARKAAGRRLFGWLYRKLPPLLVFTALGGLLVWGYHTGWTMPKFSSLAGHAGDEQSDWCSEHNVPESQCVECNPESAAQAEMPRLVQIARGPRMPALPPGSRPSQGPARKSLPCILARAKRPER